MQLLDWAAAYFATSQQPFELFDPSTKIAVIGTGIAGAAVTARLLELLPEVEITVFEQNAVVGGRLASTVHPYGQFQALEGGASLFGIDDQCVIDLLHKVGLKHGSEVPLSELPAGVGFPHRPTGQLGVFCDLETTEWRRLRDLTWRYGLSFWRVRRLIASAVSQRKSSNGQLEPALLGSAQQYFEAHRVSQKLQEEVLQPCVESRSFKQIGESTALSALLSARQSTMTAVVGGNAQIAKRVFEKVQLKLNSLVRAVTTGSSRRFKLRYSSNDGDSEAEFDVVVVAAPLTGIELDMEVPEVEYEPRHVTYVASSQSLSSVERFGYLDVRQLSDSVAASSNISQHDVNAVSIRLKCGVHQPDEDSCGSENVYRIVSRLELDDTSLMALIDAVPGSDNSSLADHGISWVQRYAWPNALPKWKAAVPLIEVELAPGLFYTAGKEPVISSLEMACQMGRHAAEKVELSLKKA